MSDIEPTLPDEEQDDGQVEEPRFGGLPYDDVELEAGVLGPDPRPAA